MNAPKSTFPAQFRGNQALPSKHTTKPSCYVPSASELHNRDTQCSKAPSHIMNSARCSMTYTQSLPRLKANQRCQGPHEALIPDTIWVQKFPKAGPHIHTELRQARNSGRVWHPMRTPHPMGTPLGLGFCRLWLLGRNFGLPRTFCHIVCQSTIQV